MRPSSTVPVQRPVAAGLTLLALFFGWQMPAWPIWILLVLAGYATLLRFFSTAWLLVVPWALTGLDLAPWSGRLFFDEFDLILLVTFAGALWHKPPVNDSRWLSPQLKLAGALFALTSMTALVIGLLPFPELDANAFSNYRGNFNALRIAKGFAWSGVVALLLGWIPTDERPQATRLMMIGMGLGLVTVGAVGTWERWLFADLFDFSSVYRVMATFSSMHVGGGHIEVYLVMALPFSWYLLRTANHPLEFALAAAALLLGSFVSIGTVSRSALAGLTVVVLIYVAGALAQKGRWKNLSPWQLIAVPVLVIATSAIFAAGVSGSFFQARLARSGEDMAVRLKHWQQAVRIMDDDWGTLLFGMGLGRFPATYLFRAKLKRPLATYQFHSDNNNIYLVLGSGEALYVTQRVDIQPQSLYRLALRARSPGHPARLTVNLCERHLSHSRRCVWPSVAIPGDGRWHAREIWIDSKSIGEGSWFTQAPVDFGLYNPTRGISIMVDDLRLNDADGNSILLNGDFEAGADHWFIKTHEHLSWHIKNLWIQIFFEQGLTGLVAFFVLVAVLLRRLGCAARRGSDLALAATAAVGGFLTVGLVVSPFDAPRITLLFFTLATYALWASAEESKHA